VEHASFTGLQELNNAQRETIDKQQLSNDAQQRDISSCVVSLGKLNPKIREQFAVITIPLATTNVSGKLVDSATTLLVRYLLEVLVVTNEIEPRFRGKIRCDKPFKVWSPPQIAKTSQTASFTTYPSIPVSANEYEIRADATGPNGIHLTRSISASLQMSRM
jgi:hypothetical protein